MKKKFKIEGIQCEGCIHRIEQVLSGIKGVLSYELSLEEKTLQVEVKKEKNLEEVIEKIDNLGFKVIR